MLCPLKFSVVGSFIDNGVDRDKIDKIEKEVINLLSCDKEKCAWWCKKEEEVTYTENEIEKSEEHTHTELEKIPNTNLYKNTIIIESCAIKLIAEK